MKKRKIKCSCCGETLTVGGFIWDHRLRSSEVDETGNYIGWNCDYCAGRLERGEDLYA